MQISAATVKVLREKTGAGMMECKKALQQASGDMDRAIDWLRTQGLATAAKKVGRTAAEGMISHYLEANGRLAALAEVNCETDFVVKTPEFQRFAADVVKFVAASAPKDLETLLAGRIDGGTVAETQTNLVARIGEKIGARRFALRRADGGCRLGCYIHAGSKIGVIVTFADPAGKLSPEAAKDIAMHVAAMHPQYVRRDAVPADIVAREQEIQRAQLVGEKKPPEILEKIVTGRMGKFFAEVCLEEQVFVKDPEGKRSVAQVLKAIDGGIRILDMVRMQVGEVLK